MFPSSCFAIKKDLSVVIGNQYIVRSFSIKNNKLYTEFLLNRRTENELKIVPQAGSEEFAVNIICSAWSKKQILSSDLIIKNINIKENADSNLVEFIFEPYSLKNITYNFKMIVEINNDDHFMKKYITISTSNDNNVKIDYVDTERLVLGNDIVQKWSRPDMKKAFIPGFQAALGQPIYLNGMFTGSEFPVNDNNIVNGVARLRYYSGRTLEQMKCGKDNYATWKTVFGAARSLDLNVIRDDFLEYIKTISTEIYLRTQYNSWYDHMLDITADNIRNSFYEIEKGLTQYGVKPVDAYVVDDGWNDYEKDFWCFNSKFPNELYESSDLAKKFSSEFGLWLGPRGGYNYNTKFAKRMEKSKKGGYNSSSLDICIADNNYVKNIQELFLDYMGRFDISYWKLDGFMLKACKSKKHGHPTGGYHQMYCYVDCWEKWIKIFETMRAFREKQGKSLWINQTCYVPPSPWFLQWTNSIWMQNTDDIGYTDKTKSGKAMNGKDFDRMLTYRDAKYFDFHKTRMLQFPNSNMYNHEPIYGNTAKIHMENDEYRKYMYMIATRGTAFWELYYSFNLFNPSMWRINADVLKFIEDNFSVLRNSRLIGETPEKGSVYGYSAWNNNTGIISLRNPMNYTQKFSVVLDRNIGVSEGIDSLTRVNVIPYDEKVCEKTYSYSDTLEVELGAHEIVIYKFSQSDNESPELINAKFIDNNVVEFTFNKHVFINSDSFKCNGNILSSTVMENYSQIRTEVDNKLINDSVSIDFTVKDVYENSTSQTVVIKHYNDMLITNSKENPEEIKFDFSIRCKVKEIVKDTVLLSQGNEFALFVANGCVHFDCKGVKAKALTDISGKQNVTVTALREKNGMLKIYIDKKLDGSAFDESIINPVIEKSEIKLGNNIEEFKIIDKAFAFDEI